MADIKEFIERELRNYERERNMARQKAETNKVMQECYNEFTCVLRDILAQLDKEDFEYDDYGNWTRCLRKVKDPGETPRSVKIIERKYIYR